MVMSMFPSSHAGATVPSNVSAMVPSSVARSTVANTINLMAQNDEDDMSDDEFDFEDKVERSDGLDGDIERPKTP